MTRPHLRGFVALWLRGFFLVPSCLLLAACVPRTDTPVVIGPEPEHDLRVTAETASPTLFEGATVQFAATPEGGTPPYRFRWDQNAGPVDLDLAPDDQSTLSAGPLETPGRYVLRVIVTDAQNFHAEDYVPIEIVAGFTAEAPALAVVGEPVQLQATVNADIEDATLLWEVTSGSATIDDPDSAAPTLTAETTETIDVRLTVSIPGSGNEPVTQSQEFEIVSVANLKPRVGIQTNIGAIIIELDGESAPLHTAHFLRYVDEGFYDGLLFHRNACRLNPLTMECTRFVLQGGGFERIDGALVQREPTREPVSSEADNGLSNGVINSVALALTGNNPDSGNTQFFINLHTENDFLDDLGFTVFGQVVDGTEFVDIIAQIPTEESPVIEGEPSLPTVDIVMMQVTREP